MLGTPVGFLGHEPTILANRPQYNAEVGTV